MDESPQLKVKDRQNNKDRVKLFLKNPADCVNRLEQKYLKKVKPLFKKAKVRSPQPISEILEDVLLENRSV